MKVSECVNENFQRVNEREENEGGYTLSEEVAAREPLRIVRAWRCESADAVEAARPIRTGKNRHIRIAMNEEIVDKGSIFFFFFFFL